MHYYNENNPHAAQWLRNLIDGGLIPPGHVDEKSITEVNPDDLHKFNQCHFFAGIGGWSHALQLAGIEPDVALWTGSCPCQPISSAGKRKGEKDERHLWPEFYRLISECEPPVVFGEQVASKDGREWLAGVRIDLEEMDYAVGAADMPAASIGAPHKRNRLWWVAELGYSNRKRCDREQILRQRLPKIDGTSGIEAVPDPKGPEFDRVRPFKNEKQGRFANNRFEIMFDERELGNGITARRIKPGLEPLANGVPFRLADGRTGKNQSRQKILEGIGNAINPKVAAEFISAYCERGSS